MLAGEGAMRARPRRGRGRSNVRSSGRIWGGALDGGVPSVGVKIWTAPSKIERGTAVSHGGPITRDLGHHSERQRHENSAIATGLK